MPSANHNTRQFAVLFAVLGFVLGFCFPGAFAEWIFYTTKPFHFLDEWIVFILAALFALSATTIPFAAAVVPRSASAVSHRGTLLVFSGIWVVASLLTSLVVSLVTALIHHQTLSIPDWLISAGLLLVPVVAAITILIAGFWRARRYEPCG
jgi:hypothetical protein